MALLFDLLVILKQNEPKGERKQAETRKKRRVNRNNREYVTREEEIKRS